MRVLDLVPDDHRRILHRALREVAESGELTFLAYAKSPYYQMPPEMLRRLNASSIIVTAGGRHQKTFQHLAETFASEERIVSWWMWLIMRFSDRGAILRTHRIENRKLVFLRQDVADRLSEELKRRFGKSLPYDGRPNPETAAAPAAAAFATAAAAEDDGSANASSGGGGWGGAAPRDQQTLEPAGLPLILEDVAEIALNPEVRDLQEYMEQLGFAQQQIQQILKDPELYRVMHTLRQARHSEAELKRLEMELLNLRLANPEFGFLSNSPAEAIDRIRELKEEKERDMVMHFLRGQLLERITLATQEALQAQQAAAPPGIAEPQPLVKAEGAAASTVSGAVDLPAPPPPERPVTLQIDTGVTAAGAVPMESDRPAAQATLPQQAATATPAPAVTAASVESVVAQSAIPTGAEAPPVPEAQAPPASLQEQVAAVQQAVAQSAIVAEIGQIQRVHHEAGDRLVFHVHLTPNLAAAHHPAVVAKAMHDAGYHRHDYEASAAPEHVQVEASFARTLELAMERHHHVPVSGSTGKGFGIGH